MTKQTSIDSTTLVSVPLPFVNEAIVYMLEASEDIRAFARDVYPEDSRDKYPSYERRYQRDIDIARKMEVLCDKLRTLGTF